MAKDFLNVLERAILMGVSDKINAATASGNDVYFYGEFPEVEEVKFPAVIIQQVSSGFVQQMMGQQMTFDGASGTGEIYGISYNVHIICEKGTVIQIGSDYYKQRRLLNWLMLNIANEITDLTFSTYEEDDLEVVERRLQSWRNIGYMPEFQWYGATCDYFLTFKNWRS